MVVNTNIDVLKAFQAVWGGDINANYKPKAHWKQAYTWRLQHQAATDFLKEIKPFLIVKKQQAEEQAKIIAANSFKPDPNCNASTNVCIMWEKSDGELSARGRAIAYRNTENEHYAEVKTQGYMSNTLVTIIHNDTIASELLGDGQPGGNTAGGLDEKGVAGGRGGAEFLPQLDGDDAGVEQGLHQARRPSSRNSISAFCACSRFSASSHTALCGPSIT